MKDINEIFPLLDKPKKIAITTHQKPDADAMGSSLGLYNFLIQFGHQVTVISPTNWANWVGWMPGSKKVLDYEMQKQKAEAALDEADWLFCLDFNHYNRTKNLAPKLASLKCTKILIDHHEEPDEQSFDYGFSDASRSSTCELIYDFILASGHKNKITPDVRNVSMQVLLQIPGRFGFPAYQQMFIG
jgi:phosphoesterase RecJ-like protein